MASTTTLPRAERAFLLGTLFHGELDVARLRELAGGPLDWPAILGVAEDYLLGALLFDSIQTAGVAAALPAPLLDRLRADRARVAARNITLLRAAERAGRLLGASGIEAVALKGTALAVHAPGYFGLRHQSDVDLLLPPAQVGQAARLLLASGFIRHPLYADLVGLDGHSPFDEVATLPPGHHLLPLVSPEGATMELHFQLPGRPPHQALEAIRAGVAVSPGGLRVPGRDALLGLLCAHVHGHHEGEPLFLLRHVADAVVLRRAGASFEEARRAFGAPVETTIRLVEQARLAVVHPGRRHRGLAEAAVAPPGWSGPELLTAWRVAFRGRWRLLLEGGRQALFPDRRYMAQRYRLGPRSLLLPLTYPWRLLSALGRALLGR
jgi:hypothetical protein